MNITKLFDTFHETAFRLECLPEYTVDSEISAIKEFNKTGIIQANLNEDWINILRTSFDRGVSVKRLRLLSRELTSYEQFELAAYRKNISAGEDIRTMYRGDFIFPQRDFWVFDMSWIAFMKYGEQGKFEGISVKKVSKLDLENIKYLMTMFEGAKPLQA